MLQWLGVLRGCFSALVPVTGPCLLQRGSGLGPSDLEGMLGSQLTKEHTFHGYLQPPLQQLLSLTPKPGLFPLGYLRVLPTPKRSQEGVRKLGLQSKNGWWEDHVESQICTTASVSSSDASGRARSPSKSQSLLLGWKLRLQPAASRWCENQKACVCFPLGRWFLPWGHPVVSVWRQKLDRCGCAYWWDSCSHSKLTEKPRGERGVSCC